MNNEWMYPIRGNAKKLGMILMMFLVLTGCAEQEEESAKETVARKYKQLTGYEAKGKMTVRHPKREAVYLVDVVYQAPHFYKVSIQSPDHRMQQTVYRNDEGVFLVTPHVNKTFRFQSGWPGPGGQVYLYQTLLKAIQEDSQGVMSKPDDGRSLIFQVRASYPHRMLTAQKIWLDPETFAPKRVEVQDEQAITRVTMEFSSFKEGKPADPLVFRLPGQTGTASVQAGTASVQADGGDLQDPAVYEPSYLPGGVGKLDEHAAVLAGRTAVFQRYDGNYTFSLWTVAPSRQSGISWSSRLVEVSGFFGLMDSPNSLVWWHDGWEHRLHSEAMPVNEMIRVAGSVEASAVKP